MRCHVAVIALLSGFLGQAQDSTWFDLSYPEFSCAWQMPAVPTVRDTLNVRVYALEVDSAMAVTAVFMKEVVPDTTSGSLYQAAFDVEDDTLRAMAQVMLQLTKGELMAIDDSTTNGVPYLNLVFSVQENEEEVATVIFSRMLYTHKRYMTFTIGCPQPQVTIGSALAEAVWSTISATTP